MKNKDAKTASTRLRCHGIAPRNPHSVESIRERLEALMPSFDDEIQTFIMRTAWTGALEWALGEPEFIVAYERETGKIAGHISTTTTGRVTDQPLDSIGLFILDFAAWFNVNVWGDME